MALDRNLRFGAAMRPISGIALVILLTLCWLVPVSMAGDSNFLWDMIHGDVLPKIVGGQQSHGAPPGYFLLLFPLMCLPASLLLPQAIAKAVTSRKESLIRFLIAWIIPNWLFFALVPTKLPQYALPMYPAICILMAMALFEGIKITSKLRYVVRAYQILWVVYLVALSAAIVIYVHRIDGVYSLISLIIAACILIFGFSMLVYLRSARVKAFMFCAVMLAITTWPLVFAVELPGMQDFWLTQKIVKRLDHLNLTKTITNQKPLVATGYTEPSLVFNLGTDKVRYLALDALEQTLKNHQASVALLLEKQYPLFKKRAKAIHLHYKLQSKVYGFRYNGGHWQTVLIIT